MRESMVDIPAGWHCWLLDVPSEERRLVGLSCVGQSLLITALSVRLLVVRGTRLLVRHHRWLKVGSTAQSAVLHLCREGWILRVVIFQSLSYCENILFEVV